MAAGGRAVLGWAAAFAGVWAGAACSAPQGGAGLEGVYFGLRADQISERVRTDYYTFLADGRAFRGFPSEGLGRAVDWDYECRYAECGTYERRGDEIRFRNDASGSDTTFRLDAAGVLRKQERPISYRRMHLLDAERLDGTWGVFDREKARRSSRCNLVRTAVSARLGCCAISPGRSSAPTPVRARRRWSRRDAAPMRSARARSSCAMTPGRRCI